MMYYTKMDSPVGELLLAATDKALTGIYFDDEAPAVGGDWKRQSDHPVLRKTQTQLEEYFAGKRKAFDLPLAPEGTVFQRQVWKVLARIPYGETRSYGDIARRIRRPKAVRAVGAANGANPIPIVVPCHRVIGSNGSLTGYGGGLDRKQHLLALEKQS
ncbi:MAG: methylated-DNA--[protein]-cysteine S-methyltransferase [Gammaproteobacteria bacterium]|nr:methylated-DNA--[protein]-cysteine S-methyltransferase [Gammaproteobacteria bacterium]